jgi:hypothetical protein
MFGLEAFFLKEKESYFMNEVFAIDPIAPKDLKDIKSIVSKFGMEHGRFIANFPDDWASLLLNHANDMSGLDRSRLIILLNKFKDSLIQVKMGYQRSKSWEDNVYKITSNIYKILGDNPNKYGFPTLDSYLWGDDAIEDNSRGEHIPMTISAYKSAVLPLFQISSEIHIADPFFQLRDDFGSKDNRRIDILQAFIDVASESSRCDSIKIHFKRRQNITESVQESECIRDLSYFLDVGKHGISLSFDIHNDMTHGRYIFGIKGGMQFDHGFSLGSKKTNHVHWLSKKELTPIQLIYGL